MHIMVSKRCLHGQHSAAIKGGEPTYLGRHRLGPSKVRVDGPPPRRRARLRLHLALTAWRAVEAGSDAARAWLVLTWRCDLPVWMWVLLWGDDETAAVFLGNDRLWQAETSKPRRKCMCGLGALLGCVFVCLRCGGCCCARCSTFFAASFRRLSLATAAPEQPTHQPTDASAAHNASSTRNWRAGPEIGSAG